MKVPKRRPFLTGFLTVLTVLLVWLDFFHDPGVLAPGGPEPVQQEAEPVEAAPTQPADDFHPVRLMEQFVHALAVNPEVKDSEAD